MKRHAKELVKELESLGYEFERVNAKSMHVYSRGGDEVIVSPGVSDNAARQILRQVKRRLGCPDEVAKRNPEQIKARQAADRERAAVEVERVERERDALILKRSRLLAGHGSALTRREIRDIEDLIRDKDREHREWLSLMTGVPSSAEHRGNRQARHRAGGAA